MAYFGSAHDSVASHQLAAVTYYCVDDGRSDPWNRGSSALHSLDFGLELAFGPIVLGLTWRQVGHMFALHVITGSLRSGFPAARSYDVHTIEPWKDLLAQRVVGLREYLHSASGDAEALEIDFGSRTIVVAAASYLPDEDRVLNGCDEIIVFKDSAGAQTYLGLPHRRESKESTSGTTFQEAKMKKWLTKWGFKIP